MNIGAKILGIMNPFENGQFIPNEAREAKKPGFRNLILVPGHAPFKSDVKEIPADIDVLGGDSRIDDLLVLQDFQKGEGPKYVEHIKTGMELAAEHPDAMLVFSGACTREQGGWTEAETYEKLAERLAKQIAERTGNDKFGNVLPKIRRDEGALDSFQNAFGALAVFEEETGNRPDSTLVVGWDFKEGRFRDHFATLGESIKYYGVTSPEGEENKAAALRGEARTVEAFRQDPLGIGPDLKGKREKRNVNGFNQVEYYEDKVKGDPKLREIADRSFKNHVEHPLFFRDNQSLGA